MVSREDLVGDKPDGTKIFMVAMELMTVLYALLYAFPHVPTGVIDEEGHQKAFTWFNVTSTEALRAAVQNLLQTSDILEFSLPSGAATAADITVEAVANPRILSALFDLRLYACHVPRTARQMLESVSAAYRAILTIDILTRDELYSLYRRYQVLPAAYSLPGTLRMATEKPALIKFCTELAVTWIQPYFSKDAAFYVPADPALAKEFGVICDRDRLCAVAAHLRRHGGGWC